MSTLTRPAFYYVCCTVNLNDNTDYDYPNQGPWTLNEALTFFRLAASLDKVSSLEFILIPKADPV